MKTTTGLLAVVASFALAVSAQAQAAKNNSYSSLVGAGGSTRARGLSLSLVGKFSVTPVINLLGKIGTTYSDTDVSANASALPLLMKHGPG